MGNVTVVNDANFEQEVLKSDLPVLVDFWATWCPPCRMIAPIVEELATDYAGRFKIAKLDTDMSPGVPGRYGIQSIPTLIVFQNGKELGRLVGARPKAAFTQALDSVLAATPA